MPLRAIKLFQKYSLTTLDSRPFWSGVNYSIYCEGEKITEFNGPQHDMKKIIVDQAIPYIKGVFEDYAEVLYLPAEKIDRNTVSTSDALIIRTRTHCNRELLEGLSVKTIATATIGYDHIDTVYCQRAGIEVFTAAGSNARGVLQWMGAALAYASSRQCWEPFQKTIGIIGTGHVGSLIAHYTRLWGFDVMCCDPLLEEMGNKPVSGKRFYSFAEITSLADIISFHTPLTFLPPHPTFHMADVEFFDTIKSGSLIINCSRGAVIDTPSLREAIGYGKCSAIIDTWENEPQIDRDLLANTVLATPHVAGYSAQGKANASAMSIRAIASFFGWNQLERWYPYRDVTPVTPCEISWKRLNDTISSYYDIAHESRILKNSPLNFEQMRSSYSYRQEYF